MCDFSVGEDEFVDAFAGQVPETKDVHVPADLNEDDECALFFKEESERLFVQDVVRGSICAFVAGTTSDAARTTVTVESILRFMPGVRVAIAAEDAALGTYKRYGSETVPFICKRCLPPHVELVDLPTTCRRHSFACQTCAYYLIHTEPTPYHL